MTAMYWSHVAAIDLPLCQHAGQEWILLPALACSLGIAPTRLQQAARRCGALTAQLQRQIAVLRTELPLLTKCLKPGRNNALLALTTQAEHIAATRQSCPLAAKAAAVRQRQMAIQNAMRRHDSGASVEQLLPEWVQTTGLSRNSLCKVLRGTYTSKAATLAHNALARRPQEKHIRTGTGKGRLARIDVNTILAIRCAHKSGEAFKSLACKHDTKPEIVKAIVKGQYATSAMKAALAHEKLTETAA